MKDKLIILLGVAIIVLLFLLSRKNTETVIETVYTTDTIIWIDTVIHTVFEPYKTVEVQTDTLFVYLEKDVEAGDTVAVQVSIEEISYKGEDYDLTIGGYKPYLKNLIVFPRTIEVTNTKIQTIKKTNRFGIGIQTGYGIIGNDMLPYIGIGIQYNIISF